MGFSGGLGSKGFNNSIGAAGVDLPKHKRQRGGVRIPNANSIQMWFMSKPNGKGERTFSLGNGRRIHTLRDFSGKRNHLKQPSAAKQPTVSANNGSAGIPAALQFTTAQFLVGDSTSAFDVGTGAFDIYMIINLSASSSTQVFYSTTTSIAASTIGIAAMAANDEKLRVTGANGSSAKTTAKTSAAYNGKGYFLLRFCRTGTTTQCYTLCADGTSQSVTKADGGISFDGGKFSLGALNNGNTGVAGKITEVIAYKGIKLGDTKRDEVRSYLSTKYKLGL